MLQIGKNPIDLGITEAEPFGQRGVELVIRRCRDDPALARVVTAAESPRGHPADDTFARYRAAHDKMMSAPAMIGAVAVGAQCATKFAGGKGGDLSGHAQRFQRRVELVQAGRQGFEQARMVGGLIGVGVPTAEPNVEDLPARAQPLTRGDHLCHHF